MCAVIASHIRVAIGSSGRIRRFLRLCLMRFKRSLPGESSELSHYSGGPFHCGLLAILLALLSFGYTTVPINEGNQARRCGTIILRMTHRCVSLSKKLSGYAAIGTVYAAIATNAEIPNHFLSSDRAFSAVIAFSKP